MPSCYELLGRSFHIDLDDGIRWTRLEPPYSSAEAAIAVFDVMARGGLRLRVRGPAIVGNFGGGRFFDYTAYGDTINIAARLETANKQLGTRICVSAILAAKVKDFMGRPVGSLLLRGRSEALRAFEPLRAEQYEDPSTKSYLDAFAKLEAGDPGAIAAFAAHVGKRPDDQLASFHLKRVLNGATGTRIAMD